MIHSCPGCSTETKLRKMVNNIKFDLEDFFLIFLLFFPIFILLFIKIYFYFLDAITLLALKYGYDSVCFALFIIFIIEIILYKIMSEWIENNIKIRKKVKRK